MEQHKSSVNSLVELGLIELDTDSGDRMAEKLGLPPEGLKASAYVITQTGYDWLEFHKSRKWKFWIPIIISTIALVVSIIALINPT